MSKERSARGSESGPAVIVDSPWLPVSLATLYFSVVYFSLFQFILFTLFYFIYFILFVWSSTTILRIQGPQPVSDDSTRTYLCGDLLSWHHRHSLPCGSTASQRRKQTERDRPTEQTNNQQPRPQEGQLGIGFKGHDQRGARHLNNFAVGGLGFREVPGQG